MCRHFGTDDYGWNFIFGGITIMVDLKNRRKTREYYDKAKGELLLFEQRSLEFEHSAISDVIPNYKSDLFEFWGI